MTNTGKQHRRTQTLYDSRGLEKCGFRMHYTGVRYGMIRDWAQASLGEPTAIHNLLVLS